MNVSVIKCYLRAVKMRREWTSYSTLTEGLRSSIIHSQTHIPSRSPSRSNQRPVDHSRDKKGEWLRQMETVLSRVRELEGRMIQSEHRVNTLERNNKKTVQLTSQLEEFMRNRYPETKVKDSVEKRMATFEQALGHLSTVKADRKELENIQIGRYYGMTERCNELQRQGERVNGEIAEINAKYQRMIGKIENSFLTMNQKYEQFIETNFIQTIERVNNVTKHYNEKIQLLDRNMNLIVKKVEHLENIPTRGDTKQHTLCSQLMGISLPHIRLIQTISIREERKLKGNLNGFKEHIKQQHKDAIPLSESGSTSSTLSSETLLNIYDYNDNNTGSEMFFQKAVYKVDRDFNLLDENEHYIMTSRGKPIQLSAAHIIMLKENGLFI